MRWFTAERQLVWDLYFNLPGIGPGWEQAARTDYYLRTGSTDAGVKIREGNHEIKVKSAYDEPVAFGMIQHWVKWSSVEDESILDVIAPALLADWISVEKQRYLKRYAVDASSGIQPVDQEYVDEGCGVEFTEIRFPFMSMETFSYVYQNIN